MPTVSRNSPRSTSKPSFLNEAEIHWGLTESMIRKLFKEVLDLEFGEFPHMTFVRGQCGRYGSDKPDLRIPLEWSTLPTS